MVGHAGSSYASTRRCHLPFDGISTTSSTPKQKKKVDEKDVQPTHVQMEQEKKESPLVGVETDVVLKEVLGTCFFHKTIVFVFVFCSRTLLIVFIF